jgi:hypothetical protein
MIAVWFERTGFGSHPLFLGHTRSALNRDENSVFDEKSFSPSTKAHLP